MGQTGGLPPTKGLMDERTWRVFFEIHSGLPREAPGDDDSTRRALKACALPPAAGILDIGCGPGAQTIVAADVFPDAHLIALDRHYPFLVELIRRADAAGCREGIAPLRADMNMLPVADRSFDLVLAEGSAYILGIEKALTVCRDLLREGGHVAFSDLVWLTHTPPPEAKAYFDSEYPAMTTPEQRVEMIRRAGFEMIEQFRLPDTSWWDNYYTPMQERLDMLREKYAGDDHALAVIAESQQEIHIRRDYGGSYGYEFFVAKL